jgi:hypothetical protein
MMTRLLTMMLMLQGISVMAQQLKPADLLFHVAPAANQITNVTPGMIDHVAIVMNKDSLIEAKHRGVVITPLDSLRHQEGYYLIGRVQHADSRQSLVNARRYLGRSYDFVFLADNDDIYCSELVQLSMVDCQGKRLFTTVPMSFHDATGHITDYWIQFYAQRGMAVPEGQPGTNPAELSQRKLIKIIGRLH